MRLLNAVTGEFVEDRDSRKTCYCNLSHTWDQDGEQSYQDVRRIQDSFKLRADSAFFATHAAISWPILLVLSTLLCLLSTVLAHGHLTRSRLLVRICDERLADLVAGLERWAKQLEESSLGLGPHGSVLDDPRLSAKIRRACALARQHGFDLVWIDSCCIDKTSSSELSEAINSMYAWYRDAVICFAFLADVPSGDPCTKKSAFGGSRWFRRGWTLQELIAPRVVVFLSCTWAFLGTKATLETVIEDVTHIDTSVLTHTKRLDDVTVCQRMSWASTRKTTRPEDEAYSLLGIFDIHMPTIYGEGPRAFFRLQEEIIKRIPDQSIFAWGISSNRPLSRSKFLVPPFSDRRTRASLFAESPADFASSANIRVRPLSHAELVKRIGIPELGLPQYTTTSYDVRTSFPFIRVEDYFSRRDDTQEPAQDDIQGDLFAILACEPAEPLDTISGTYVVAILCSIERRGPGFTLVRGTEAEATATYHRQRVVFLSPAHLHRHRTEEVYIPISVPPPTDDARHYATLSLAHWCLSVLQERGYATSVQEPQRDRVILSKNETCIQVALGPRWRAADHKDKGPYHDDIPIWITIYDKTRTGAAAVLPSSPSFTFQMSAPNDPRDFTLDTSEHRIAMRFGWSYCKTDPSRVILDMEMLSEYRSAPQLTVSNGNAQAREAGGSSIGAGGRGRRRRGHGRRSLR